MQRTIVGINGIVEHHDYIPFRALYEEWEPSAVQRNIDEDRVLGIVASIQEKRNIQGTFSFTIAEMDGRRHLVDGQHRMTALSILMQTDPTIADLAIHVRIIPLESMEQAVQLVNELGNVKPVDPVGTVEERACLNMFEDWMSRCMNKPMKSQQPRYGNYSASFIDNLKRVEFFRRFDNAGRFMEKCLELNRWLFDKVIHIGRSKLTNVMELAKFISPDTSRFSASTFDTFCSRYAKLRNDADRIFCLHFLVNYGCAEVIKYMYDLNLTPDQILRMYGKKDLNFNFNQNIERSTSAVVIANFFDRNPERLCPVCQDITIMENDRSSFALGHIVAHSRGGSNEVGNLIPICHKCNLDCRAEHLYDYCKRKYGRSMV